MFALSSLKSSSSLPVRIKTNSSNVNNYSKTKYVFHSIGILLSFNSKYLFSSPPYLCDICIDDFKEPSLEIVELLLNRFIQDPIHIQFHILLFVALSHWKGFSTRLNKPNAHVFIKKLKLTLIFNLFFTLSSCRCVSPYTSYSIAKVYCRSFSRSPSYARIWLNPLNVAESNYSMSKSETGSPISFL